MHLTSRQVEPPTGPICSELSLGFWGGFGSHSWPLEPWWHLPFKLIFLHEDGNCKLHSFSHSKVETQQGCCFFVVVFFPDCSLTWNQPEAWLHPENVLLEIQTNKFWTTCLKREGNVYIQNMKSDGKTSCGPAREFRSRPLQQISPCCRGGGRQKRQITVTW